MTQFSYQWTVRIGHISFFLLELKQNGYYRIVFHNLSNKLGGNLLKAHVHIN